MGLDDTLTNIRCRKADIWHIGSHRHVGGVESLFILTFRL
jgi:hypothetical protein